MPAPLLSYNELQTENSILQQKVTELEQEKAELKREKNDLELLSLTNIEHSDFVAEELLNTLHSTRTTLLAKITRLHHEVRTLRAEITQLKHEKADLELLIEMNTEHADYIEEDLLNKVEFTLRESEQRFRLISETIPVPITVSRISDHRILYVNEPASFFFGRTASALQQSSLLDFYDQEVQVGLRKALAGDGYLNNYELQGRKANHTPFYGALYARPLTFNETPCLLCALHDMTDRKRAEDEIRQLNEDLEARVRQRTQELEDAHQKIMKLEKEALEIQMAGGFAHEMRNALVGAELMLNTVMSNEHTLCEQDADILGQLYNFLAPRISQEHHAVLLQFFQQLDEHAETLDNVLKMVQRATGNALEVTTQILDYSRLGRTNVGNEQIQLRQVIERIAESHALKFREQGVRLELDMQTDGFITGYESHFHSIINNIVLNARDELIELDDERLRQITLSLREEEQKIVIAISDTANGIAEEDLAKIFEPFFSTKPTTGTGLGLSFVSKLVPMYHGAIDITSEVGRGTTFTLTFPSTHSS